MKLRSLVVLAFAFTLFASSAHADGEGMNGFPNWAERVEHEWVNRARCDPQVEMTACGTTKCPEGSCYTPVVPLSWDLGLNRSARFHADEMQQQSYFAHDSVCTVVSNINSIYPGSCNGAASCACTGGTKACPCTTWSNRVKLFGTNPSGEIIASPSDPDKAFYLWLFESFNSSTCAYNQGPPTNGHRWNILKGGPAIGMGVTAGSVGDFGGSASSPKIPSGSHYPRQAASIEAWANWHDSAAPKTADINVDGACTAMTLGRGSATNGAWKATLTGLASGCHRYFFSFTDSADKIVTYPTTGSLGIGPAGSCADWDVTRPSSGTGCGACAPACAAHACGSDGCGGTCGPCASNETCTAELCVANSGTAGVSGASGSGGMSGAGAGGAGVANGDAGADGGAAVAKDAGVVSAGAGNAAPGNDPSGVAGSVGASGTGAFPINGGAAGLSAATSNGASPAATGCGCRVLASRGSTRGGEGAGLFVLAIAAFRWRRRP